MVSLRRAGERQKGGLFSFLGKRIAPLIPPKRTRGEIPSPPNIAGLGLEELHALRSVGAVYMASP